MIPLADQIAAVRHALTEAQGAGDSALALNAAAVTLEWLAKNERVIRAYVDAGKDLPALKAVFKTFADLDSAVIKTKE